MGRERKREGKKERKKREKRKVGKVERKKRGGKKEEKEEREVSLPENFGQRTTERKGKNSLL